jgi:hypothetical protein
MRYGILLTALLVLTLRTEICAVDLGRGLWLGGVVRAGGAYDFFRDGLGPQDYGVGKIYEFKYKTDPFFELELRQEGKYGAKFWVNEGIAFQPRGIGWLNLGPFYISLGSMDAFVVGRTGDAYHLGRINGANIRYNTPLPGLRLDWFFPAFESYEDNKPAGTYAPANMFGESVFGVSYDNRWVSLRFGLRLQDVENAPAADEKVKDTMRGVWEAGVNNIRNLEAAIDGELYHISDGASFISNNHIRVLYDFSDLLLPPVSKIERFRFGFAPHFYYMGEGEGWTGRTYGNKPYKNRIEFQPLLAWELRVRTPALNKAPLTWTAETGPLVRWTKDWTVSANLLDREPVLWEYYLKTGFRYDFTDKVNIQLQYQFWWRFEYTGADIDYTSWQRHLAALWVTWIFE